MSVIKSLLLSNVIDADHQNNCLFTNKMPFVITFLDYSVFELNTMGNTLPIALSRLLE